MVHEMAEIVAVRHVNGGRRPATRGIHQFASGVEQHDGIGRRQVAHLLAQELVSRFVLERQAELLGGGEVLWLDMRADVLQGAVNQLHVT